jgi:hypothetical protein
MADAPREAWLDALAARQRKLEKELTELNAAREDMEARLRGVKGLEEAASALRADAAQAKTLAELEAGAEAAGRERAEAARRELDQARGREGSPSRRGRPGMVRL